MGKPAGISMRPGTAWSVAVCSACGCSICRSQQSVMNRLELDL